MNTIKFLAVAILSLTIATGCNNGLGSGGINPIPKINNPQNPIGLGPAPVSLSTNGGEVIGRDMSSSGSYVIMAKTGVTNTTGSLIKGDIAISPAAGAPPYLTGFGETLDASGEFATSDSVEGRIYAATYAPPTPSNLTVAIGNMETAYTDGAGRSDPDFTELHAGDLSGKTLTPGLYKWGNTVLIDTDVYLSGSATDVFIFQIAGDVEMASAKSVIMQGGVLAKNVYWIVAGQMTIGVRAHFEGVVLSKTAVTLQTEASMIGRIYAQTLVTLDNNAITQP